MSYTTKLCDLCRARPATVRVDVVEDGRGRTLDLCEHDYTRLRRERPRSPWESLFDEFLPPEGVHRGENREAVDVQAYLSQQARDLLQAAAKATVESGNRELDTEHVLYALTESEVVREILRKLKLSAEDVRGYVEHNAPRGELRAAKGETVTIGITPRVKAVLERAFAASRELGHAYVGPEHLLIGLVEEPDGLGGDILRRYGVTPEGVRRKAVQVVGRGRDEDRAEPRSATPNLDKHSRDLTALARQGKLDPVIGRAKEIETVIEVLARRKKNNPVLLGDPGVGKTAIVEGLAQRVARDEVPEVLRGKRLVELSVNSLVAGTKYRGEFEERVKELLDEIIAHQDELILFIDELHTIVGAGQAEGGLDIANTLKPALARGDLHLIGATTLNEYQKHVEKDAALERRFQPVFIAEPTVDQTIHILRGLRDRFEAHHKVRITDEAIVAAAEISDRYMSGRYLPDKAIDLVDQAGARVRIATSSRPAEVQDLEAEIRTLKREQEYATSRKQFEQAQQLEATIKAKETELDEATQKWRKNVASGTPEVRVGHVAEIVSSLTGIPVAELTAEERDRLLKLEEVLHERVVGQDEAVAAVSAAVRLSRAGLKEGHRPTATFLFLGPSGVGKTELAKTLAWAVFGDEEAVVRVDMSEYTERHTVSRLVGAPPGYVGYDEGGQLTERVRRRPYSVILLDEIEKAHPEVHNILLQVFDDGRLTDGKGRVVDFSNAILIATSNIGSDLIQHNLTAPEGKRLQYAALKEQLMEVLRHQFRPEFLNRIDEVIVFHALTRDHIRDIVLLQLERVRRVARGQGVELEFDPPLVDHLADAGYRPEYGARELKRRIRSEVENALARALLQQEISEGDSVRITYDLDCGQVRLDRISVARDSSRPEGERSVEPAGD